jgi:hydroxymethylbilane synthase
VFVSLDGKEKIEVDKVVPIEEWKKVSFLLKRS